MEPILVLPHVDASLQGIPFKRGEVRPANLVLIAMANLLPFPQAPLADTDGQPTGEVNQVPVPEGYEIVPIDEWPVKQQRDDYGRKIGAALKGEALFEKLFGTPYDDGLVPQLQPVRKIATPETSSSKTKEKSTKKSST